ncbi:asparagine--tRNA ligase, partial [Myxococcota bacterium]|nr:asparagine--tRNA ligase [Myxococcota bacterium]
MRIKELLNTENIGKQVTVKGWVRTRRASSQVVFIEINDGSCFSNLQLVFDSGTLPSATLGTGTAIAATGTLVESPAPKQPVELRGESLTVIGETPADYPLQKKRHSLEFLREIAHLRPRANTFGAVFRIRNILSYAVHRFFQERQFMYLAAPIITTSDCEGAGEMFHVTNFNLDNPPRKENGAIPWEQDFFGKPAALTVSGQLEAEIFACSLGNCYTFGPTFRAENSNTSRHLAEFWMIEPEIAFADLNDDMDLAEDFIRYLIKATLDEGREDLEFFDQRIQKGLIELLERLAVAPFTRITYTEAIAQLEKAGDRFEFKPFWGADLQSEHERFLTEEVFNGPVFVTDYPKDIKAFYMRVNDDGRTVAAMDCLLPRIGEIIGGSQREERHDSLLARIREMNLIEEDY